ncbi:MAG TPA: hypothetical protein V6D06_04695 [Trichocoleus sp.]
MSTFQPHQIVYLEKGRSRLYAEAIQIVADRALCWARPLALVEQTLDVAPSETHGQPLALAFSEAGEVYPLVDGPDILWPLEHFKPALDTDVLPLLELMHQEKSEGCDRSRTHERLQQFIRQFWP